MWAQSWTGNAPAEGTTFYLYNVGQNKFLTSGHWWGTHAALDTDGMPVTLTASDGAYKIYDTAVSFGTEKGLGSDGYVDNGSPAAWTFTQVGSTSKYTLKNGDNYFMSNGSGIPVNTTTEPTTDDGYWQLVTKDQLIANLNNATPSNPIDASFYMTNPRVRRNWPKAIEGTALSDNGSFNAGAEGLYNGGCTSYGQYHKTFDNYQALTGVKNGKYKVTVKGFNRLDGGDNNSAAYLYANDQKVTLKTKGTLAKDDAENATKALVDDTYLSDVVTVTVTDGNLRIGVKSDANCGWTTFAQFTLMFVDPYISDMAIPFTSGNTMEAGLWYSYTVPTDGDYTLSATEGIVYAVADGLNSEATTAATSTVALPAGTVYFKSATTQALTITYVEPVVANGEYYLYNAATQKFLSRGANFGSRSTIDIYGIPVVWNNYTKCLQFKDTPSLFIFFDNTPATSWTYTDGGSDREYRYFAFEAVEGGYILKDNNNTACLWTEDNAIVKPTAIANKANAIVWTLKTKAEHDAIVAAYPASNKTAVITAASLTSETDATGFETWLATNRAAKDKTSSVGTAKFTGAVGDWTWTGVRSQSGQPAYGTDWAEIFQATGDFSQEITGLSEGIYKVTVNAFERETGYATCNTLGAAGYEITTAYFEANGQKVQLKSWYSDKTGTNNPDNTNQAATAFNNDKYKNEVYCYVGDDGKLTLKLAKPSYASGSWVLFNNVTLTYYDSNVSDEDATAILAEATTQLAKPMKPTLYTALNTAKTTFDGDKTVPNYNALRTAIDNTATSVASYANMYTNYLEPLTTYLATTNFVDRNSAEYTAYADYKAKYDSYKNAETADIENAAANALTVASGAGTNYTSMYTKMLMSNWKIGETVATTNNSGFYMNTWSTESAGTDDAADFANPFFEYWVSSGSLAATTLTGTLTGLTANTAYDITVKVRVQGSSKVAGSITMEVVGGVPMDVTAGNQIGETDRYIKSYTATGVTDASGNLELKFNVAANSNISWLAFRDINYAVSTTTASNDFTALNTAISTAEGYTLGFETGEYAPYTNIAGIQALATAKAFDQDRYYTPAAITAATTALTETSWTVNTEELNAFYDGDFSECTEDNASPLDYTPAGWTPSGNMRVMLKDTDTYPGVAAASATTAMMSWSAGITYGEQTGYEMPLKPNAVYTLKLKAAGWENQTRSGISVSILNGTEGMALYNLGTPDRDIKGNETNTAGMKSYEIVFATGAAGNYVFHIQSGNNMVITDFEIKKASQVLEFADGSVPTYAPGTYPSVKITRTLTAGRWATAVYPFSVPTTAINDIAVLDSYNAETGELGFTSAASTANEPFLMRSSANISEINLSNVAVEAIAEAPAVTKDGVASLIGAYTSTDITNAEKNYVLSANTIYEVGTAGATINPYRAYIQMAEGAAEARSLTFVIDGEATAIKGIDTDKQMGNGNVYNLKGQKVSGQLKKGVYVVDGKKVAIK